MSTSTVAPLFVQMPLNPNDSDHVMLINQDGTIVQQPNIRYERPNRFRRAFEKIRHPKNHYVIEQEGLAYRKCQWCRQWFTRKCPTMDFCDRIFACPLLCWLLSGLFLLSLFIALLTLFALHPAINSSRRYYGIISLLSIYNKTTYIYGLDTLCNKYATVNNCMNITTSTSISIVATTINRTIPTTNYSFLLLVFSCVWIFCHYRYCRN